MSAYLTDLESLHFHTPPGLRAPRLLEDFYAWVSDLETPALGYFSLQGDRLDDFWVEDGSRRATAFVSFLRCKDGSRVGWWRPNAEPLDVAPIVLLGGEGELRAEARSLEAFLGRWAARRSSIDDLQSDEPEAERDHAALLAWLRERDVAEQSEDADLESVSAELRQWFDRWAAERAEHARTDAERVKLAELLWDVVDLPSAEKPWQRTFADVIVTSRQCQLFGSLVGQRPLALSGGLEAAIRAFREHDVRELPEAGLWFRAMLQLDADGVLCVKRSYLEQPNAREIQLDARGLAEDAARMPRTPYWTPAWLGRA